MSITDELRDCIRTANRSYEDVRNPYNDREILYIPEEELLAIADRIDEQHAVTVERLEKYRAAVDAMLKEYVKLPVDADGVPIHIGDVMEGVDKYDSLKNVMGKVITVSFESDGIVDVAIRAWSSDGKSWHRAYLDSDASVYRHYHEPTVEDMLREFANKVCSGDHLVKDGTFIGLEDTDLLAEYANRLRLAGEGA